MTATTIRTWRAVARILGMHVDTLLRQRRRYGCRVRQPWFEDPQEVRAWYRALVAPPPPPEPRRRAPRRRASGEAIDVAAAAREIARGLDR